MRKQIFATILAIGLLAPALFTAPAGANAGEKIRIKIENNDKVTKKYAGMPVNDASSEFVADPETCKAAPFCTLVPMEVALPSGFNPDINEFVVSVRLGWNDQGLSAGGQGAQGNDLDMYIYNEQKDAKGATVYKEVGRSAGAKQPETAKLFSPSLTNYLIVVYNFLGINDGFEIALTYRDATIRELGEFEGAAVGRPTSSGGSTSADNDADGSSFGGGETASDAGSAFRPSATSRTPRPTPSSPSLLPSAPDGFSTGGPTVFAVPTSADDSDTFDLPIGVGGARNLASDLAPNETQDVFQTKVADGDPGPASGLLMGFWLGVAPLALGAGIAFLMRRRRPAALSFQLS